MTQNRLHTNRSLANNTDMIHAQKLSDMSPGTKRVYREIPFSPPDIGEDERKAVIEALESGWITTGPQTKAFERSIAAFVTTEHAACFSSATAALECVLRALGIGAGDEVITSAYTYTATAASIVHVGATPVLVDVTPNSYEMSLDGLAHALTSRTRAVIPVDIAGVMCNYDGIMDTLCAHRALWTPRTEREEALGRVAVIADAAHSFGAMRKAIPSGAAADISVFSFHAVKNLTTAEGGAATWRSDLGFDSEDFYRDLMLLSLHGQTKDALDKTRLGAWEYDVIFPGWKCNMTDIQAALGQAQLRRYDELLARRHEIAHTYTYTLAPLELDVIAHEGFDFRSSAHLTLVRLPGRTRSVRDQLIERMAHDGVATNVHYKPLPLLTAYQKLGFRIEDFPNAYAQFENEITLPLHTHLSDDDVDYVCERFAWHLADLDAKGCL